MKCAVGKVILFGIVAAAHFAGLALAVTYSSSSPKAIATPTLQGILLPAPPAEIIEAPKPEPVEKPRPKPPKKPEKKKIEKVVESTPAKAPDIETTIEKTPEPIIEEARLYEQPTPPTPAPNENSRSGATLTPPTLDANPLNNPAPAYPKISRRLKEQGIVLLEILIQPDGSVGEVRLKQSSGYPRLDKTAIRAIKKWRYIPAREGDTPVEYWYLQALEFTLH